MYKTWVASATDAETLARNLEIHLNEFASEVISVSYAVNDVHQVLAVYREIDMSVEQRAEEAVNVAEHILDGAQL
jgi:hypothetical protein